MEPLRKCLPWFCNEFTRFNILKQMEKRYKIFFINTSFDIEIICNKKKTLKIYTAYLQSKIFQFNILSHASKAFITPETGNTYICGSTGLYKFICPFLVIFSLTFNFFTLRRQHLKKTLFAKKNVIYYCKICCINQNFYSHLKHFLYEGLLFDEPGFISKTNVC